MHISAQTGRRVGLWIASLTLALVAVGPAPRAQESGEAARRRVFDQILDTKRREVAQRRERTPVESLKETIGTLVHSSATEIVIRRTEERAGTVYVHFPRIGFEVTSAESPSGAGPGEISVSLIE